MTKKALRLSIIHELINKVNRSHLPLIDEDLSRGNIRPICGHRSPLLCRSLLQAHASMTREALSEKARYKYK